MKYLLAAFFSIINICVMHAQDILEQQEEQVTDSVMSYEDSMRIVMMSWTPEERWLYGLRNRMDSVLQNHRTTTTTVYTGRGRRRRATRKTITRNYHVGMTVYDLTADSTIFSYNDNDLYIPASTQKLFVSITALSTIGSNHHFRTDVSYDGTVETDSIYHVDSIWHDSINVEVKIDTIFRKYLKGNVYVSSGFDPTLDKNAIEYVACKVMALDVDSIDGYIYAYEPQKRMVSGQWFWDKHPSRFFASSLYQALKDDGVAFSADKAYSSLSVPLDHKTYGLTSLYTPLPIILKRMMKNSDNFYAESMLLNLCDLRDVNKWTYNSCTQKVKEMVGKAGGRTSDYIIDDGSGLSHSNKTTPIIETQILRYAYHNKDIYELLYESLPIAGVDGTLSSRMIGTPAYRNVRAKTGTVNGVQTLAGYVKASNGHFLAFSIMVNNNYDQAGGRSLQNQLCAEMAK